MEIKRLFTSIVKKLLIKLAPLAAIVSVGCFVASFLYLPTEFIELKTRTGFVKSIEKNIRQSRKGRGCSWGIKSKGLEYYCILVEDSTSNTSVYTLEIEKIDSYGMNNIIGRDVRCEYSQELDRTNTLYSLSVNGKPVITYKTDWISYLSLLFIFLATGVWVIWIIVIELNKEGYFKDSKEKPRIFKK